MPQERTEAIVSQQGEVISLTTTVTTDEAFTSVDEAIQNKGNSEIRSQWATAIYLLGGAGLLLAGTVVTGLGSVESAVGENNPEKITAGVALFMVGVSALRETWKSASVTRRTQTQVKALEETK